MQADSATKYVMTSAQATMTPTTESASRTAFTVISITILAIFLEFL